MVKLVETVIRHEHQRRKLDAAILAIGAMSLGLAVIGTLATHDAEVVTDGGHMAAISAV